MKRFGIFVAGVFALAASVAVAAPPYTANTSGTTINGVLDALTDIYSKLSGSTGVDYSVNAASVPMSGFTLRPSLPTRRDPLWKCRTRALEQSRSCATTAQALM